MNGILFITHATEKYDTLSSARIALEGGCRQIQLRMKESAPDEILRVGKIIKELCDAYGAQLYIDDYPEICLQLHATGVHLGKTDMAPLQARKLLGNMYKIGGTANTFEDIIHLAEEGADYIGLGPFQFTTTKKNLSPVLGLEGYRQIVSQCRENRINLPIVAIGGITRTEIPALMQTGINGIALSSAILQAADPVAETRYLIEQIKQYSI
ncbi:MAG: thiamine phosphate synthase [Tannerellaceae bacterium]|nr:thiamine phosphate synthase [Tannerellaceae bacterium]